jgi:hypothetical protein
MSNRSIASTCPVSAPPVKQLIRRHGGVDDCLARSAQCINHILPPNAVKRRDCAPDAATMDVFSVLSEKSIWREFVCLGRINYIGD